MRTPAYKRLRLLPEAFTTKTLAASLGGDEKLASVYLYRWRKDGLIKSIGPRAGLHFNLLRNPSADKDLFLEGVAFLFPGAVIGGVSAVHSAGWTTQIPRSIEIMVPSRRSFPEIDDCSLSSRSRQWVKMARNHLVTPGPVPTLSPAFAMADLWATGDWRPDPDDIEWDMVNPEHLQEAFNLFEVAIPDEWRPEMENAQLYLDI